MREWTSLEDTDKLADSLFSATRSLMEDSKSTPILEDSKWAWHPEILEDTEGNELSEPRP